METYPNSFRGEGREDVRREQRAMLEQRGSVCNGSSGAYDGAGGQVHLQFGE